MTKKQKFFDLGTGKIQVQKKTGKKSGCSSCGLFHDCDTPYFKSVPGDSKIVLLLENPSASEDQNGEALYGKSGQWLQKQLNRLDINPTIVYAVKCAGEVSDTEIQACRGRLLKELTEINPDIIIPSGVNSIKALIGGQLTGRLSGVKYKYFIGEKIPLQNYWVCPIEAHYIAYNTLEKDSSIAGDFCEMLKDALLQIEKEKDFSEPELHILDEVGAIEFFNKDFNGQIWAFDYETTGIKPHDKGHEIISVSFCSGIKAYSFLITEKILPFLKEWLENKDIKKIVHNLGFEDSWSYIRAGADIKGWYWDTLLGAHCLNNNKPTGQKFLVYSKFGIIYDSKVDEFLKATDKEKELYGNNAINKIRSAPVDELLKYNALDSFYCYKLYKEQRRDFKKLPPQMIEGFKFFVEGAISLAHVHRNGIQVDMPGMKKQEAILTRRIDYFYKKIMDAPELKKWKNKKSFNPDSGQMVGHLLYKILGYDKPGKGGIGTSEQEADEKALSAIGIKFTDDLLKYRQFKKIRDTYLGQFKREAVGGELFPFFSLHIPKSFRSSGNSPNLQNIPKRDPEAKKRVRVLIIPRKGNKLVEYDYSGVEVSVGACIHKDKNMIKYLRAPKNNMHRDTSADIFLKASEDIIKEERQIGKNKFVFPAFYGSTYKAMAPAIWDEIQKHPTLLQNLKNKGIKNFKKFKKHIEKVESIFWNERFYGYKAWKTKVWKQYQKDGFIDLVTGFRAYGPMSFTELINRPVQGPAFHVLLWTLIHVQKELDTGKCKRSFIIGQVHDSLVCDIHPDDEKEFDTMVKYYGTKAVMEYWKWITIPLNIDKEAGYVNGDWTTLEEVEF